MITEVLEKLNKENYYGGGKSIEFAKGSRKIPTTLREGLKKIKRVCR